MRWKDRRMMENLSCSMSGNKEEKGTDEMKDFMAKSFNVYPEGEVGTNPDRLVTKSNHRSAFISKSSVLGHQTKLGLKRQATSTTMIRVRIHSLQANDSL
ncbi:hypothetical protein PoB_005699800 [Plakobranchus ocellatus]|uniref:Uncharacterized protein n=1 Tax=Plakobranchus ocellatus TaxID=259542 RepID=A0AAV4CHG8_9GAST|nr:hypothetical protein PoB_005699800 [Plakobranchus ocellatus]